MKYKIESKITGVEFGEFKGESEDEALDNLARQAGYRDYDDLLGNVPINRKDELNIIEL